MSSVPLIAHVIYALGTGGLENGLVNIINRTPTDRYRHVIICLTTAQEFAQRITTANVQIVELHKKSGHDPGMYWRLWRVLRNLRPDIVHSRNLAPLETQILGLIMPGTKRVHGEHGRDVNDLDGSNRKYRMLRKSLRPLIHRYIAVSKDLADWLSVTIAVPHQRINQIYNGVDQSRFIPRKGDRPALLPEKFLAADNAVIFGTVGRLAEVKDQRRLIEAFSLLLESYPAWRKRARLLIVGDGSLWQPLQNQLVELGLSELVWMAGDREDIPALLQLMDVFLLPSLAEGVSNTVLEAMATGLPVIATDVGGNPELVEHGVTGYLVPVGNAQALSAVMAELFLSEKMRSDMGDKALASIRARFDWDKTVNQYLGIYDELLGRNDAQAVHDDSNAPVNEMRAR